MQRKIPQKLIYEWTVTWKVVTLFWKENKSEITHNGVIFRKLKIGSKYEGLWVNVLLLYNTLFFASKQRQLLFKAFFAFIMTSYHESSTDIKLLS